MSEKLKGKSGVVTGSGRGIGREVALAMAGEGANVVVVDPGVARDGSGTTAAPADEVVAEIQKNGGTAIANYGSVVDFKAAESIIKACVDKFGRIDFLVNCAGILRERMIWNMSEEEWDAVIAVHLKGTFNCSRHACVFMREQKAGRIINLTSDAWRGTVGQCNYGAAKGGIVSLTRAIAREMGRFGVTCNALCPVAATRMTMTEEVKAGMKKRLEAGLITKEAFEGFAAMPGPEYIPPMAIYLATDAAANINGQVLHVERGRVAIYSEPVEIRAIYKSEAGGAWTVDDLEEDIPKTILTGYVNPAPPAPEERKTGS
jgi:3-oxoacyl-[acyl-carrier protein] reductase